MKDKFSSVTQSCQTLCNLMDCSMPCLLIHRQLPELAQTHVRWVRWCHLILCHPLLSCHQSFQASGSFQMSQFFISDGQTIGASVSASVLPMNVQDWFPLGLTGLITLQFKGLFQESFPTPQFKSINPSALSFLYSPTLRSIHDFWKNHSFD